MNHMRAYGWLLILIAACSCQSGADKKKGVPVIGFVDAFEDNTIAQAKTGFIAALQKNGFSEKDHTVEIIYRNAQGNIPTLTQIVKYFIAEKVDLIASSPSLSTITAIQNTHEIPVFMMVAPEPQLMKVIDAQGKAPANLLGVGENLEYIDTSFALIPQLVKPKKDVLTVGMIYNQSEPQSTEALDRIKALADKLHINMISLPVNTSADVQLVTRSLLNKGIDAFFANPDNTVFASFETIIKACNEAKVPVFTSEAGLVTRGAVAAYGADIYQWGYQAGEQAAQFLKQKSAAGMTWQMVQVRKRVYNPTAARQFNISVPANFEPVQ
ncbi:ABC transporter substrate-binding protein [Chitinophaga defluvii]|uniref:ABC transporter substrate-binding protein n=1 Tax=Chitinophaga defluvii TaxID=3163343 RepID=A0ABV2T446_9BACT